ncbi:MAG: hypothetical protein DRJ43_05010, partial [Thermoprotei archaeon]
TAGTIDKLLSGTINYIESGSVDIGTVGTILAGNVTVTGSVDVGTIYAGTIDVASVGTISMIKTGTVTISGTTDVNITNAFVNVTGTVDIATIVAGNVTVSGQVDVGTLQSGTVTVTAGSIDVGNVGTVGYISAGNITVTGQVDVGTLYGGTITIGTIQAGTVAISQGTVSIAGTADVNITNAVIQTVTSGTVNISAGTIETVQEIGTLTQIGTLQTGSVVVSGTVLVSSVEAGNINVSGSVDIGTIYAGTIDIRSGSVEIVGTTDVNITNAYIETVTSGTVNISAGTIETVQEIGTLTQIGTLQTGSVYVTGTVLVSSVEAGNITVDGQVDVGTIYAGTIDIASGTVSITGTADVNITNATINTITSGTVSIEAGTISSIQSGSINITAGTINTVENITTIGTIQTGNVTVTGTVDVSTITAGSVNVGSVGVIGTIQTGTMNITAGTINTVESITQIGTILSGSMNVTGSVDIGTIYSGSISITAGTIDTIQAGSVTVEQISPFKMTSFPRNPYDIIVLELSETKSGDPYTGRMDNDFDRDPRGYLIITDGTYIYSIRTRDDSTIDSANPTAQVPWSYTSASVEGIAFHKEEKKVYVFVVTETDTGTRICCVKYIVENDGSFTYDSSNEVTISFGDYDVPVACATEHRGTVYLICQHALVMQADGTMIVGYYNEVLRLNADYTTTSVYTIGNISAAGRSAMTSDDVFIYIKPESTESTKIYVYDSEFNNVDVIDTGLSGFAFMAIWDINSIAISVSSDEIRIYNITVRHKVEIAYGTIDNVTTVNTLKNGTVEITNLPYSTSPNHSTVLVSTVATKIVSANSNRSAVIIKNLGTVDVYIGSSTVEVGNSVPLSAGEWMVFEMFRGELYGIAQADTTVAWLELS